MTVGLTDKMAENEPADQTFIENQSMSSDDTIFLDLPLPPVPDQAVHVYNLDETGAADRSAAMMRVADDFCLAPIYSAESGTVSACSSASSLSLEQRGQRDDDANNVWSSSSDESTRFYCDRERLSQFRCTESLTSASMGDLQLCEKGTNNDTWGDVILIFVSFTFTQLLWMTNFIHLLHYIVSLWFVFGLVIFTTQNNRYR